MSGTVHEMYPAYLISDLAASGLDPQDVRARLAGPSEKQATNTPLGVDAYVLPYFDMYSKPQQFYRTKLIDPPDPKVRYKQVATSSNHVYFPLGFNALLQRSNVVIITEGEKKAAKAVKEGFCCCALGGVESWRNRTIVLSADAQIGTGTGNTVTAKLPPGSEVTERVDSLAFGLKELIDYCVRHNKTIVICYDTDTDTRDPIKFEVQRAAAALGFELRHRGVPFNRIRQLVLSPENADLEGTKLGLDDFLVNEELGPKVLREQLDACLAQRQAFPRHPNTREYIGRKLQKTNIPRSDMHALSLAMVSDMDAKGLRMRCPDDDNMYYFDEQAHRLLKVNITAQLDFSKTDFGIKLYNDYGLTAGDQRILSVFTTQFCAEQPLANVKPEKIMAVRGDVAYVQVSDGSMVRIDAEAIQWVQNGADDVLFEGGMVEEIKQPPLVAAVRMFRAQGTLQPKWYEVLKSARIKDSPDDNTRRLLTLLYSISPWFYRWRSSQLPLEQMLGEAGSGKSTLFALRQRIISGKSSLRNAPKDLRDWTASIANTGALHVTDNVHMANGGLKQQLSDELCRVITEHDPHIESRKLYTDNDLIQVPVRCVFAVTAIKQPFTNVDIIQRSIITEMDKGNEEVEYDSNWEETQLQLFGGRTQWLAHQFVFMQRLFQRIRDEWDPKYRAKYRLINIEQLLILAAKVYGWDHEWIPGYLEQTRDEQTTKTDAALEGLTDWASDIREKFMHNRKELGKRGYTVQDMVNYFESHEEWSQNPILTNGRSLGSYIEGKKNTVSKIAGILSLEKKIHNRNAYQVVFREQDEPTDP